jgi:SAM-dependent methyltransferase
MVDTAELRKRVESFSRWHYEFDLGGVRTPVFDRALVNRHAQRRAYFFAPLTRLCGGSLAGKRVLDLGCNAGFWSLAAIEAGAELVVGIDGRQIHIDQANLVFEAKGVDRARYRFTQGDVFTAELEQAPFNVVLCLGLLYHVSKPFDLIERIAAWSDDLLVIDTTLSTAGGPFFRLAAQDLDEPRAAIDRSFALHPTSEAVETLTRHHGYRCAMLRPSFSSWEGARRYRDGSRRAFICAKRTALDGLDTEPAGANVPAAIALRQGMRRSRDAARLWVRRRRSGSLHRPSDITDAPNPNSKPERDSRRLGD